MPVGAAIGGLPHPTSAGTEVERHRVDRVASYGHHAAAAEWPDAPPLQGTKQVWLDHGLGRYAGRSLRFCHRAPPSLHWRVSHPNTLTGWCQRQYPR